MREDLQLLYELVSDDLAAGDPAAAAHRCAKMEPSDVADLFRSMESDDKIAIVRHLDAPTAAAILSEVDDRSLPELFELLRDEEIVDLLDTLPSDDAADIVGQLEDDHQDRVVGMLEQVDQQDAAELTELLRYPEDTAGGVMAKEYVSIREDQQVGAALPELRAMPDSELADLHFAFVVLADGTLVGRIPLLKMLLSDPTCPARDIMEEEPVAVNVLEDQERVAHLISDYNLMSVPVVDAAGKLVGRVTVDDAIDVLTEEATEDVARLAGSSAEEVGETSILRISRARLPWLLLGLFGQILAAVVLSRYEDSLRTWEVLVFFIPMVMATGGNTGIQTSTIVIRLLVTHEFDTRRAGRHLMRELGVNSLIGVLLGGVMVAVLAFWKKDLRVGVVIGVAITSVVLISATVGSMVPLILHRFRIDPTIATGPFITTVNDILGIAVYMALAHWLMTVL